MRTIYIPCRENPEILLDALNSLRGQIDSFVVFNNMNRDMPMEIKSFPGVTIIDPPDSLLYGQSLNAAIKMADRAGDKYCLWAHTDIIAKPGVIDTLFRKYDELKDTKWGVIWTNYDSLCLFNPRFFIDEDCWDDVVFFSTYFGDNHRAMLMKLRGYSMTYAEEAAPLVIHLGSHTINKNPTFGIRNSFIFPIQSSLYQNLWGGSPGGERVTDSTCHGIYPIRS